MDTCETPAPVDLDALPPWEQEAARPYASPWRSLSKCFPAHKPVRQLPASPKTEDREPKTSLAPRVRLKRLEQEAVEVLLLHMSCGVKSAFSLFRARCVRKPDGTLGLESAPKRKPRKPAKRAKKSLAERRELSRRARKAHASRVKRDVLLQTAFENGVPPEKLARPARKRRPKRGDPGGFSRQPLDLWRSADTISPMKLRPAASALSEAAVSAVATPSSAFDPADRLTAVTHVQGGNTVAGASYLLDDAGNRLRETHHDGSFTSYGYDAAYRLTTEHYKSALADEWRTYTYTPGGDRIRETALGVVSWEHSWADNFNRAELGADYSISGGEWALTGEADKQLERITSDPEKQSGPGLVTNNATTFAGAAQISAKLIPVDGTVEKPLTSAVVFGWRNAGANYWLAGTKTWMAAPEGEEQARLHVKYFIAEFDDSKPAGEKLAVKAESGDPEILPVGVSAVEIKLRSVGSALALSRKYTGADWDERLTTASPWTASSPMPESRVGVYSDREEPDAAGAKFDDLKVEWPGEGVTEDAAVYNYGNDKLHQLYSVTGLGKDATYAYDDDGNRTLEVKGGVSTNYGYNFENRLLNVMRGGNTIRSYAYQGDSWQRRTGIEDGVTTSFLYDGANAVAEYDGAGALQAHHVTNGLDKTLWSMRGANMQTPLSGAQNVLAVADNTGVVTQRFRYRAFGERVTLYGGAPNRTDPTFQNRTYDSGLGIYDYRNRSFDPATGRFLQRDPKLGGDSLMNPYCFPGNNPVTNADPMGTRLMGAEYDEVAKALTKLWKEKKETPTGFTGSNDREAVANRRNGEKDDFTVFELLDENRETFKYVKASDVDARAFKLRESLPNLLVEQQKAERAALNAKAQAEYEAYLRDSTAVGDKGWRWVLPTTDRGEEMMKEAGPEISELTFGINYEKASPAEWIFWAATLPVGGKGPQAFRYARTARGKLKVSEKVMEKEWQAIQKLKREREAAEKAEAAGQSGRKAIEKHHELPGEFKENFERAGLNIEDFKLPMERGEHRLKPEGLHTGKEHWNKQWRDFFDKYPQAKKQQILDQLGEMRKDFGVTSAR